MPVDRRPFRIEKGHAPGDEERELRATDEPGDYGPLFAKVFDELADIRSLLQQGGGVARPSQGVDDDAEALRSADVMAEIESIHQAISQTKREILSIQVKGLRGGEASSRAFDELDAVVNGTEAATDTILSSVENIEDVTAKLLPRLQGSESAMVLDIHRNAIKIFEACNFQDLTGQRISKVVEVLHFIEDRINIMMAIWGGEDGFSSIPVTDDKTPDQKTGDAALLNGPPLQTDENVVSQDDIDSLFA